MTARDLSTMNPERRQALLETAAREFASAGYEGASLNRIIRACGMSTSSFYHYLDSKEALFDTVVREAATALRRDLAIPNPERLAGPDFWDQIARLGDRLLALSGERAWYVDFGRLFYLPDAPAGASREVQAILGQVTGWLREVLTVGRKEGAVRDDLPASLQTGLTLAVLSTLDRWALTALDDLDPGSIEDLSRLQLDLIKRLLAP
jgi:AcrR family transcriptional regulator